MEDVFPGSFIFITYYQIEKKIFRKTNRQLATNEIILLHNSIQKFDHKSTAEVFHVHLCLPVVTFLHWQPDRAKKVHSEAFAP